MSSPSVVPRLERPAFAHGQRLLPEDLNGLLHYHQQVRWLHNRTLHDWGIALGLGVSGSKGEREVVVEPGYALDCDGHDLILCEPVTLQVPPVAGMEDGSPRTYLLTASWLEDEALRRAESRGGVCEGGGAVRLVEAPLVRWQDPSNVSVPEGRFRPGLDVVLASAQVKDCRLAADLSGALRRSARLECTPYVATGRTAPASTVWRTASVSGRAVGIETDVNTEEAGFQRTPYYIATVEGPRLLSAAGSAGAALVDGLASVLSASPTGFTLRVTLPRDLNAGTYPLNPAASLGGGLPGRLRTELEWRVVWLGLEG